MPQALKGTVIEARKADDTLVFRAKFRTVTRTLGNEPQWDRKRAEAFVRNTLRPAAAAGLPWWDLIPRATETDPKDRPVTVIEACSDKLADFEGRCESARTLSAFNSPVLKHVLPYFAYERDDLTGRVLEPRRERVMTSVDDLSVSRFIAAKLHERKVMRDLPDVLEELDDETLADPDLVKAQLDQDKDEEWELLLRYGQRGGRWALSDPDGHGRVSLSSRGLTNSQINLCLSRLRSIVKFCNRRYRLGMYDPTEEQSLKADEPDHDFIEPRQFQAMLDAARQFDAGVVTPVQPRVQMRNGKPVLIRGYGQPARLASTEQGREAAVLLLGLCGPRVSEFCAAADGDLLRGGLRIPDSKTAAGRRTLALPHIVRAALEERRGRAFLFASANGTKRDRNNVRNRLLAPVLARASELLEERGHDPLPARVVPHTLRRTAITYWAWAGRQERWSMAQAGHKTARMTMECYAQPFPDDEEALAMVLAWHEGLPVLPR